MADSGMPKLLCAFNKARMYEAEDGVVLFWSKRPVALFPSLDSAIRYVYLEFIGSGKSKYPWLG